MTSKHKKSIWRQLRKRTRGPRHWLIYAAGRTLAAALNLLPIAAAIWLGGRLGALAWHVQPHLRRRTLHNLDLVYGDRLSPEEKRRIARGVFRQAGFGLAEMLTLSRWTRADFERRVVYGGDKSLKQHQAESKALMVVGAHFGNWELGVAYAGAVQEVEMCAVVREQSNPYIERWIRDLRNRFHMEILHRGQEGIGLFRRARQGKIVVMLVDQNIDGPGMELPFLGVPSHTFLGPAIIAQRLQARVLPILVHREPGAKRLVFDIIEVVDPPAEGSTDEQVEWYARRMNDIISEKILRYPDQWMWFHDRWGKVKKVKKGNAKLKMQND